MTTYTKPDVTETMSFDDALENMIQRFEAVQDMEPDEARRFAKESADIEEFYPSGFLQQVAGVVRAEKLGDHDEETRKLMENERIVHLISLVPKGRKVLP